MNEPIEQKKIGDNSPQASANAHVGVGTFLAIAAFGISCLGLGLSLSLQSGTDSKIQGVVAILKAEMRGDIEREKIRNDELTHRVEVAENHWRNGDTAILNLQSSVRKLEVQRARN